MNIIAMNVNVNVMGCPACLCRLLSRATPPFRPTCLPGMSHYLMLPSCLYGTVQSTTPTPSSPASSCITSGSGAPSRTTQPPLTTHHPSPKARCRHSVTPVRHATIEPRPRVRDDQRRRGPGPLQPRFVRDPWFGLSRVPICPIARCLSGGLFIAERLGIV